MNDLLKSLVERKGGSTFLKLSSVAITIFVISLIVLAGPASAINVSITGFSVTNPEKGELTTTTAEVEILSNERIKLDRPARIKVNNREICEFNPVTGQKISGCNGVDISVLMGPQNYGFGYGYGYGAPYGYGYHEGYSNSNVNYNITINSSVIDVGNNEIELIIDLEEKEYNSNNQIVNVSIPQTQQHVSQPVVVVENDTEELVFDSASTSSGDVEVNVPNTIAPEQEIKLNLQSVVQNDQTTVQNQVTLKREATETTQKYEAVIPAGTKITGSAGWDGKITVPTVKPSTSVSKPNATINTVIELGSNVEIKFDKPVKIVIGGQAGKKAAWARGTSALTEITTVCNSVSNPTNIDTITNQECYIDSGSDLLIWTYHFTTFASYSPTYTPACYVDNDCNHLDNNYCSGTSRMHDEGKCISGTCTTQTTTIQNCNDGLYCNGQETCNPSTVTCQAGTPVSCSAFNLQSFASCTSDSNPFTLDIRSAFYSSCDEATDSCTQSSGTWTHVCDVEYCGAECDAQHSCAPKSCDYKDGCVGKDYYDYNDVMGTCGSSSCKCEYPQCSAENAKITKNDERCGGIPPECSKDSDCSLNNREFCIGGLLNTEIGKCILGTCSSQLISSQCSVDKCNAQCDATHSCNATNCDYKDGCVGNDYYDYQNVANTCTDLCSCTNNQCSTTNAIITRNDARCVIPFVANLGESGKLCSGNILSTKKIFTKTSYSDEQCMNYCEGLDANCCQIYIGQTEVHCYAKDGYSLTDSSYGDKHQAVVIQEPQPVIIGDFNNDGCVDAKDFSMFAANYGKTITPEREKYNLNGDKTIGARDFAIFATNYGKGCD